MNKITEFNKFDGEALHSEPLQLPYCDLTKNYMRYSQDVMDSKSPELIVNHLLQLLQHTEGRLDHQIIAQQSMSRIDNNLYFERAYADELAKAIVEEARKHGLRVKMNDFEPTESTENPGDTSGHGRVKAALLKLGALFSGVTKSPNPTQFDLVLESILKFDNNQIDAFQRSSPTTAKNVINYISIVNRKQ